MSEPALQVDADALRSLSSKLGGRADAVAALDPAPLGQAAADAMRATAVGTEAARMTDPIKRAYLALALTIRDMSMTANGSANDYEATDLGFADVLKRYEAGLR